MIHCARFCSLTALIVLLSLPLYAEEERTNRRLAIVDFNEVDEDFAFQGEYSGTIYREHSRYGNCYRRVGLQVVALGDGKFSAVEYAGGLPGSGWYRGQRIPMQGQRQGDTLLLRSPSQQVAVQPLRARVVSSAGHTLGVLKKVHRTSSSLGACPPHGAIVLFDGTGSEQFKNGKMTNDGLLRTGTELKNSYRDYALHIEFRLPYMPYARRQGRANSGVYLQSRYEVQILDSFGLEGKFNECAALYRYRKPDVNMCFPPLSWQTYDIYFRSPRFDRAGRKIDLARLTVYHNGVVVHRHLAVKRKTGAGRPEGPELLPTMLQHHGNPVHFRNIWLVDHAAPSRSLATYGRHARLPRLRAWKPFGRFRLLRRGRGIFCR